MRPFPLVKKIANERSYQLNLSLAIHGLPSAFLFQQSFHRHQYLRLLVVQLL